MTAQCDIGMDRWKGECLHGPALPSLLEVPCAGLVLSEVSVIVFLLQGSSTSGNEASHAFSAVGGCWCVQLHHAAADLKRKELAG